MFWALDLDDFKGSQCGEGNYPLLAAVTRALAGGVLPPRPSTMPPRPETKPPRPNTTPPRPDTEPPQPNTPPPKPGTCYSIPPYQSSTMDAWCVGNCAVGYCPSSHCKCE